MYWCIVTIQKPVKSIGLQCHVMWTYLGLTLFTGSQPVIVVSSSCHQIGLAAHTPAAMDTTCLPAKPADTSCTDRLASQDRQARTTPVLVRQHEWATPAAMATAWGRLISLCPLWKAMSVKPSALCTSLAPAPHLVEVEEDRSSCEKVIAA